MKHDTLTVGAQLRTYCGRFWTLYMSLSLSMLLSDLEELEVSRRMTKAWIF